MFLSIIIPIHNAESYLEECLHSCLVQDVSPNQYEIICINDGSTDRSGAILDKFKQDYANISVITKKQGGVSSARNAGINAATGEYVWFVDADDFIQENIIGTLVETANSTGADRVMFRYYEFEQALSENERFEANNRMLKPTATPAGYVICSSLFRTSLLNKHALRFREGIAYAEDGLFCYEFNFLKPKATVLDEVVYYYRRNNMSATRKKSPEIEKKKIESAYRVAKVMTEYALKNAKATEGLGVNERCGVLMPDVRTIAISAAQLPRNMRRDVLDMLRKNKLFPLFLYRKPRDFFPKKFI